jgi:hypothetical protein
MPVSRVSRRPSAPALGRPGRGTGGLMARTALVLTLLAGMVPASYPNVRVDDENRPSQACFHAPIGLCPPGACVIGLESPVRTAAREKVLKVEQQDPALQLPGAGV